MTTEMPTPIALHASAHGEPFVSMPPRTGSNPLYDLARAYGVGLEAVYCFAQMHRRRVLDRLGFHQSAMTYWEKQAHRMLAEDRGYDDECAPLMRAIRSQVVDFMITQNWIKPDDDRIGSFR